MQYRTELARLLAESPLTNPKVIRDVEDFIAVGEFWLAFDTMCTWIHEDDLPISSSYHHKLTEAAKELGSEDLVGSLRELISERTEPRTNSEQPGTTS